MQIEQLIAANTAALEANTEALNKVLAASGTVPTNVVPITATTEAPKKPATKQAKQAPAAAPTPEPEPAVTETPTKVAVAASESDEFSDPLDPETTVVPGTGTPEPMKIDTDAVIAQCVETFKGKMLAADAPTKAKLKDVDFPALRAKYGLADGDKLITLAPTPEKLVALLADIQAL